MLLYLLLLLLLPNGTLILLLLRSTNDRRLLGEHLLQVLHELGHARAIPHATPVSEVRVVYPPIHPYVLPRSDHHILARVDERHGWLAGIRLRNP